MLKKLYNIFFPEQMFDGITEHMYCRGTGDILYEENNLILNKKSSYDFFTYFNSISYKKWMKYTVARELFLVLRIKGDFGLYVFGHYANGINEISKEYICRKRYNFEEMTELTIPIHAIRSTVVGFSIDTISETVLYEAYYAADVDENKTKKPRIALSTTTYKKEEYIKRNIELLTKELFSEEPYASGFIWNIIDNGRTLGEVKNIDNIKIIPNPNLGGAGGFARGMYEAINQSGYTHVLLMDDDVIFIPESFKRLYSFLSIIDETYNEYFISGAMLKMSYPNVQHEDIGVLLEKGYHMALKPNLDMNLWDSIVRNEEYTYEDGKHYYAAWWFCCIPASIVREDNLPLPVFVRGDDVEYSIRNNAKFISLNGLCIWHEGFEGKFSAALEFYQVLRNELVVSALHDNLKDVDVVGRIEKLFWEEIYKFNYKGASLLLDALEDYLKGPEFLFSINGEQSMKDKKVLDNVLKEIDESIQIDWDTYNNVEPIKPLKKFIYDYTYNGQARIPEFLISKKSIGYIPYGFGYFNSKMCLTKKNYAIDCGSNRYVELKKDRVKFKELKKRLNKLLCEYKMNSESLNNKYKDFCKDAVCECYWSNKFDITLV